MQTDPETSALSGNLSPPGGGTSKGTRQPCQKNVIAGQHPFGILLPPLRKVLWRRALKLTANEHRAEDLVQATLLKAWANRDKYKPDTQLRAWLFTILYNTFISELRKYRREVEDADGAMAATLSEEPRQDHVVALEELNAAIAMLPNVQRRALMLMGAYGYSQLEVAELCACSVGTVKSRVNRGRACLKKASCQDEADCRKAAQADRVTRRTALPPAFGAPKALMGRRNFAE